MRIDWTDEALAADVGGWPIIRDVTTVILNPETGLMEMTEPEVDPLLHQARDQGDGVDVG
jgi:hypothetical protein